MVIATLGALYASPAMTIVKPSSVKEKAKPDSPSAWDKGYSLRVDSSRVWEAVTSGDSIPFQYTGNLAGNKPVHYRVVINYSVVYSHMEPDRYPVPLLNE